MASRTRDDRIIAAVPCPDCGARIGERCLRQDGHSRVHGERRAQWQATIDRAVRALEWGLARATAGQVEWLARERDTWTRDPRAAKRFPSRAHAERAALHVGVGAATELPRA